MATIGTIPPEMLSLVFEECRDDLLTLQSCALVSHQFYQVVVPHIYGSITWYFCSAQKPPWARDSPSSMRWLTERPSRLPSFAKRVKIDTGSDVAMYQAMLPSVVKFLHGAKTLKNMVLVVEGIWPSEILNAVKEYNEACFVELDIRSDIDVSNLVVDTTYPQVQDVGFNWGRRTQLRGFSTTAQHDLTVRHILGAFPNLQNFHLSRDFREYDMQSWMGSRVFGINIHASPVSVVSTRIAPEPLPIQLQNLRVLSYIPSITSTSDSLLKNGNARCTLTTIKLLTVLELTSFTGDMPSLRYLTVGVGVGEFEALDSFQGLTAPLEAIYLKGLPVTYPLKFLGRYTQTLKEFGGQFVSPLRHHMPHPARRHWFDSLRSFSKSCPGLEKLSINLISMIDEAILKTFSMSDFPSLKQLMLVFEYQGSQCRVCHTRSFLNMSTLTELERVGVITYRPGISPFGLALRLTSWEDHETDLDFVIDMNYGIMSETKQHEHHCEVSRPILRSQQTGIARQEREWDRKQDVRRLPVVGLRDEGLLHEQRTKYGERVFLYDALYTSEDYDPWKSEDES